MGGVSEAFRGAFRGVVSGVRCQGFRFWSVDLAEGEAEGGARFLPLLNSLSIKLGKINSRFDRGLFAGVMGLGVGWLALLESGLAHKRGRLASGLQAGVMVMAVVCSVVVLGRVDSVE